jgi:hypothetical protein
VICLLIKLHLLAIPIAMRQLDGKIAGVPETGHRHLEERGLVDPVCSVPSYCAAAVEAGVVSGYAAPLSLRLATA